MKSCLTNFENSRCREFQITFLLALQYLPLWEYEKAAVVVVSMLVVASVEQLC